MNDRSLIELHHRSLRSLLQATLVMADALEQLAHQRQDNLAAQTFDGPRIRQPGPADPTLAAVLTQDRDQRAEYERLLTQIHVLATQVTDIQARALNAPRTPKDARAQQDTRTDLERDNTNRCRSCARTKDHRGDPWTEPPRVRNTCGGILDEPTPLCRWCADYVLNVGRLPTVPEVEAHHDGRRVLHRSSPTVPIGNHQVPYINLAEGA